MQNIQPIEFHGAQRTVQFHLTVNIVIWALIVLEVAIFALTSGLAQIAYSGLPSVQFRDFALGGFAGLIFVLVGHQLGLYRLSSLVHPVQNVSKIFVAIFFCIIAVVVMFFVLKTAADHSRIGFIIFCGFSSLGILAERIVGGRWLKYAADSKLISGRPVVMIGDPKEFSRADLRELFTFGINELARFNLPDLHLGLDDDGRKLVLQAVRAARLTHAREIALIMDWRYEDALTEILELLRETPLPVRLYADVSTRAVLSKHRGSQLEAYFFVEVQRPPLRWSERLIKRVLDIVLSAFALVLLSPVLATTAVLIKLESPGPVIFRQRRMGFDKRIFTILKFRTMTVMEDGESIEQAKKDDKRITAVGRILRKSSIDELPQLWNVLRGDMSLVGPRPHALAHDLEYAAKIEEYACRHHVKPGLTGAAQVRGHRGETRTLKQMADRVEWDLWYIYNWSFMLDLRIMLQTFLALVTHEAF